MSQVLLKVSDLHAYYGESHILHGVDFDVREGEVVTLLGRNGAGKTTTLRTIMGLWRAVAGEIRFDGKSIVGHKPYQITAHGVARTFQNIELFEHASVLQNLLIGRHVHNHTGLWSQLLFTPGVRAAERATRQKVEEVIDFLDLQHLEFYLLV